MNPGVQRFHFIGICGRAMGAIALALARAGHRVTGSDECMYAPMSDCLRDAGIHITTPYAAGNVPADVDMVIVGRRVSAGNPDLQAARNRGLPIMSFPELLRARFLSTSRNAVVAGGVGKTTTSAMLAWILESSGARPDYLIGGIAWNFPSPARFDAAAICVIEGDEYGSGVDDPTPKFLHYAPEVVVVTNLLEDHPDLYPDAGRLLEAFRALVRLLPADGLLVLWGDDDATASLASLAGCDVLTTGERVGTSRPITNLRLTPQGSFFHLGGAAFELPLFGRMNLRNAAQAAVAATHFGVSYEDAAWALARFKGLQSRQECREVGGCTVVIDKASHPQSLRDLCQALRQRFPARRLISVLRPRATGGRHWVYQRDLPAALAGFDRVILTSPYEHKPPATTAWRHDPFSIEMLETSLRTLAVDVTVVPAVKDVPRAVRDGVRDGDVVLLALREQFVAEIAAVERTLVDRGRSGAKQPVHFLQQPAARVLK